MHEKLLLDFVILIRQDSSCSRADKQAEENEKN